MDNTACPALAGRSPLAHQPETFIFDLIRHLIISEISFQEDIDAILTGLEIYFRLVLSHTSGVEDE
jgi:hypothetical protein